MPFESYPGSSSSVYDAIVNRPVLSTKAQVSSYADAVNTVTLIDGTVYDYSVTSTATVDNITILDATPGRGIGRWIWRPKNVVDVYFFGAIGDGIVDDTVMLQKAIDYASDNKLLLEIEGTFKVTGPLLLKEGLRGVVMSYDSRIIATGNNYTVLTSHPQSAYSKFSVHIDGQGNTLQGLKIDNALLSVFDTIRIENCVGTGLEISKTWDCVFQNITIENCGSIDSYAFSITDGGDTTNMTHILRLQVEGAKEKAIWISENTLCCLIENIHSERAYVSNSNTQTWMLGGGGVTFNNCRFHAITDDTHTGSNAQIILTGASLTVNDIRVENNVALKVNAFASSAFVLINGGGVDTIEQIGSGPYLAKNLSIAKVIGPTANVVLDNCIVQECEVGYSTTPDSWMIIRNSKIYLLSSSSIQSKVIVENSFIYSGQPVQGTTRLINTEFTTDTFAVNYRRVELFSSKIIANVTTDNGYLGLYNNSTIDGNLTIGTNRLVIADETAIVTGTVTNMGAPESSLYYGAFPTGLRTYNIGQDNPHYWVCHVSGDPGTWHKDGTVAIDPTITPSDGDLLYFSSGKWNAIAAGTEGQFLKMVSGVPTWSD